MIVRRRGRAGMAQRRRRLAQEPLCRDCHDAGRTREATEVDHIIPLSQGGKDEDDNCRSLCRDCHLERTAQQFGHRRRRRPIGTDGWPL
ncbi:HNH endonuclease signature motif containing protein [Aureimonas altamirensis]|uniref:HNH endonuclease signature motif containing protein n=1 Tax=Aureimonas altamirensis TaxID=370622 RepID=UPI003336E634